MHIVGSGQAVRVYAPVGTRFPAHHASTGLLLLAFQPEGYLETVLPPTLSAASPLTITDPGRLRTELTRIRARGYALNVGGWQIDVAGIATPVLNAEETAIAALCVAAPALPYDSCLDAQNNPDPGRGRTRHHAGDQRPAAVAR